MNDKTANNKQEVLQVGLLLARRSEDGASGKTDKNGSIVQSSHYYPFGLTMGISTDQGVQPYKYTGKELDMQHGLNLYDFSARTYDPAIGRFTTPDPLAEKYYPVSPYAYCANNPVRNIDLRGDSVTILNLGYGMTNQHMGMLIQNDAGKWQYFSVNGDNVYVLGNHMGGREFDDLAVGEWDSPQQFMDSEYNTKGDKGDNNINSFGYTEGYIIPTTPEQDNTIRSTFTDISTNEDYSIISNNCATAVQRSLNAVGINTTTTRRETDSFVSSPPKVYNSWWPSNAFRAIRNNNPNGIRITTTPRR